MDSQTDFIEPEPPNTDLLFTSPKCRKTYENRRSHSDSSKTLSSPEPELFASPIQHNTSRYGRPRKPKITEDFYNIEDILYPYERISSPARGPKKKISTNIANSQLVSSPAPLAKLDISAMKNIDLINLNSDALVSDNLAAPLLIAENGGDLAAPLLIEDNSDVSKVLKIVSDTSSNSCDFSTKGTTTPLVKSVKTYTNRKKRTSETVIESFGLPDYSPVLNGAGIEIFQEHQYALFAKADDLVVATNSGEESNSSASENDKQRVKLKIDAEKVKRAREQFKVVAKNQIIYIQEKNAVLPKTKLKPNILKSNRVTSDVNGSIIPEIKLKSKISSKKSLKSKSLDEQNSSGTPTTLINRQVSELATIKSPNILKSSDNTPKRLLTDSAFKKSSDILPKKSNNILPKKNLKVKTKILPKKSPYLKKYRNNPPKVKNTRKSSDETPLVHLKSEPKSTNATKLSLTDEKPPSQRKSNKKPLTGKKADVVSPKFKDVLPKISLSDQKSLIGKKSDVCTRNESAKEIKTPIRKSNDVSFKRLRVRKSKSLTPGSPPRKFGILVKKYNGSPKSTIINLKSSDILPKQQKNNFKTNSASKKASSISTKVISHKIKNKRKVQKKYLSNKLNPKLKMLRSADFVNHQNVEVKSYKDLVPFNNKQDHEMNETNEVDEVKLEVKTVEKYFE